MVVATQPVRSTPQEFILRNEGPLKKTLPLAGASQSQNGTGHSQTVRRMFSPKTFSLPIRTKRSQPAIHTQVSSIHAITNSLPTPHSSTPLESSKSTLLRKNTRGWGARKIRPLESTTSKLFSPPQLQRDNWPTVNLQLSTVDDPVTPLSTAFTHSHPGGGVLVLNGSSPLATPRFFYRCVLCASAFRSPDSLLSTFNFRRSISIRSPQPRFLFRATACYRPQTQGGFSKCPSIKRRSDEDRSPDRAQRRGISC